MKFPILIGAVMLVASLGYSAESTIRVDDRAVVVTTEEATDEPQALSQAVLARISKEGWRDVIYNSVGPDRAFLFFTQRSVKGTSVTQVKVTFWKALKVDGRTVTEKWVVQLDPQDVNAFLDNEFARTASKFKSGKVRSDMAGAY